MAHRTYTILNVTNPDTPIPLGTVVASSGRAACAEWRTKRGFNPFIRLVAQPPSGVRIGRLIEALALDGARRPKKS